MNSELQRCVCTCVSTGARGVELRACSAKMWELLPFQTPAELLAESWGRSRSEHASGDKWYLPQGPVGISCSFYGSEAPGSNSTELHL